LNTNIKIKPKNDGIMLIDDSIFNPNKLIDIKINDFRSNSVNSTKALLTSPKQFLPYYVADKIIERIINENKLMNNFN